jgi:cholesterol transport system auxiliary component
MNSMNEASTAQCVRLMAVGLAALSLCACGSLGTPATPPAAYYALDNAWPAAPPVARPSAPQSSSALTLIINPPHAAAGFDSPRIIYLRQPLKLEYFAHNEWVDTPARMLGPLLVTAIESSAAFSAVVLTPGAAGGDLRLDTLVVRLQHEFQSQPSRVRLTLRATLVDDRTRRVLAWREFEAVAPASSEDAYGGVLAANQAVQTVLGELSAFCAQAVQSRAKATGSKAVPSIP